MRTFKLITSIIVLMTFLQNLAAQCTNCEGDSTWNNGANSSSIGFNTEARGFASFSSGSSSTALGIATTTLGFNNYAAGDYSLVLGSYLQTHENASNSIIIGEGYSENYQLINNQAHSLLIGFNSKSPTLFVSVSRNVVTHDGTGKVAIGNVINQSGYMDPQAKLHLRADDGEEAAIFIEPNNWNAGEKARIILGDTNHFISTSKNIGVEFNSTSNFVFNGNNTGFGVEEPKAKVHINGDLLFENNLNGIIMKSEDNHCWKGTISNNGELIFSQVDCETLSSIKNVTEPKHSDVFIYPNPTNGQITVEYTGNKKNLRLEIKTISGILVATYKINKGENRIELNNIPDQVIIASIFTKKGELISTNKVVIKK